VNAVADCCNDDDNKGIDLLSHVVRSVSAKCQKELIHYFFFQFDFFQIVIVCDREPPVVGVEYIEGCQTNHPSQPNRHKPVGPSLL